MNHFPGYFIQGRFPEQEKVLAFVNCLVDYLFPIVANEAAFTDQQFIRAGEFKDKLLELLQPQNIAAKVDPTEVAAHFLEALPSVKQALLKDAGLIMAFDPAAYSYEEVILTYPGFYAIMLHRLAHILYKQKVPLIPRMIAEWSHSKTGIDINPGAVIGCPFFIDHGSGVVIGETSVIGNSVKIYQGVTLGALAVRKEDAQKKRHPTIEDEVIIYAGSSILGGDTVIGHHSIIGGNTWITESVKPHSIVYHKNQTIVSDRNLHAEPINFVI